MSRSLLLAVLATSGCGFAGAPGAPGDDAMDDVVAPSDDEPAPISAFCDDPRLRLCLEFDDTPTNGVLVDGTTYAQNVTAEAVDTLPRNGGAALAVTEASLVTVTVNPSLELRTAFTVELSANLAGLTLDPESPGGPPFEEGTLISAEGQFGLVIKPNLEVECSVGDKKVKAAAGTATFRTWHHYVCTWDGTELKLYVDRHAPRRATPTNIEFDGDPGDMLIGTEGFDDDSGLPEDPFIGAIDDLRVFDQPLTEAEICPGGCL